MMNIQITATAEFQGEYIDSVHISMADHFSLYVGEPGSYSWIADFAELSTAEEFGHILANRHGYKYVDNIIR